MTHQHPGRALTETERRMLGYALELADEQIHHRPGEYTDDDRSALGTLRDLANHGQTPAVDHGQQQPVTRQIIADTIRAFDFSDYGMDDISYRLDAEPETQEWVPALADAILAAIREWADNVDQDAERAHAMVEQASERTYRVRALGFHLEYEATAPGLAKPAREVLRDASRRIRDALDGTTPTPSSTPSTDAPKDEAATGCSSTQHCAYYGWCHRCDPGLYSVMNRVNGAIQHTDPDSHHWGPLYKAIGKVLSTIPAVTDTNRYAQAGIPTPNCDCGHQEMGAAWHRTDCPTRATATDATETVHAYPPPGSGLTPCCGRTPFELPRTDRITSEEPVTCTAPAAAEDALRYVQVVISGTDEFTTNRSALCIADHLRAEFADSIAMDITTDAREMTDDPPAPCGHRSPVTGLTPEPSTCIRPSGHEGWHRDDVDRQWASAATEATETGSCGTGHARYPDLHCTEPTSHTGPHAAPYRGGGAAWDGRDVAAIRNLLDERGQISPSHPRPFAKQAPVDASGPVPMPVEPPADR